MTTDHGVEKASTANRPDLYRFSLAEPDFLQCPYTYFDEMRDTPKDVFQLPGTSTYLVSKDELVRQVLSDPDHFSSQVGTWSTAASGAVQAQLEKIRAGGWERTPTMLLGDPPSQIRERRIILPYVTARAANVLRPGMKDIVTELFDSVASDEIVDFNNAISIPFSVRVICRVLDTPDEMWPTVLRWTDADSAAYGSFLTDDERIQHETDLVAMQRYYVNKVRELREQPPQNHVLSAVAHALVPDSDNPGTETYLDDAVAAEMARQIQTGGNETTRKYFCDMLLLLADHPQEWEEFRNDRTRASKLVEETLRLSTVLQAGLRVARTGAKVGDTEIPEGASVIPFLASANRDPSRFEYPSEFRPERRNSSGHLTFSHGLHTCPGNTIVRAEADVLLNAMADRWAKIEVIDRDKIEYEPSFLIRSVKKLHVRVTPAA